MKLGKSTITFNLGDTSFRRKTLIDDYKTLLPYLQETILENMVWNNESQSEFYRKILIGTDLFTRNDSEDYSKRGRTLTNSLVKIGLTNKKRELSKVASNWITGKTVKADSVEQALAIDTTNLVFTRQLLKLRVYDFNGINYFYPFRVGLQFVMKYQNIPQSDFLTIIHLIQPTFSNKEIEEIILDYRKVYENEEIFSEFINRHFPEDTGTHTSRHLFSNEKLDRSEFDLIFINRKSSDAQDNYFKFVNHLLEFKLSKTNDSLDNLLRIAKDSKIKKAFGFGRTIFDDSTYLKTNDIQNFIDKNWDSPFLSEDNNIIYDQFVLSKKYDLVKEYQDMTKRTFNLTGLFDFSNGLINATNQEIFRIIFESMRFSGEERISEYEENLNYSFYQDKTISQILQLDVANVLDSMKKLLNINYTSSIADIVLTQKEDRFREFIKTNFPREEIIEILPLFSTRNDNKIKKKVSESATVPTIFEYIVAIAWFYISSEDFHITKSLNLTLDGNMRPLSHASGGAGDIVIDYEKFTLMLEVTLMNSQAQKRGEWEPVLRHATNLTIDNEGKNTMTLFIANELDYNTINIWRAVASVPLKSSYKDETTNLVKIFPLTNDELLDLLVNNRNERKLLKAIDKSYTKLAGNFDSNWREYIVNESRT